jgi:adenosylcobinamide kinase / adenosylcobinamide-phosphate guanylyltransferase
MTRLTQTTLVLGGARSGKSRFGEALVAAVPPPWTYIATGQAFDDEMRDRIAEHQSRRAEGWVTRDAPVDLAAAIDATPSTSPILVDCLTLWLTNLMLGGHDVNAAQTAMLRSLSSRTSLTVLVSNEVGMGIVPDNALARRFRDEAGRLNQRIAAEASRVVFIAAGLPLVMKGSLDG